MRTRTEKTRKGFTITELIIVMLIIAILALIVLYAATRPISSARETRVQSDLHSFELAANQLLIENPELMIKSDVPEDMDELYNKYLDKELKITNGKSDKKDPWRVEYNITYSTAGRSGSDVSEFYVFVVSAGANSLYDENKIDDDDIGLIVRLSDGDIKSETFGLGTSPFDRTGADITLSSGKGAIILGEETLTT